jgi:hypothetical protein
MANYCYNEIRFYGKEETLKNIKEKMDKNCIHSFGCATTCAKSGYEDRCYGDTLYTSMEGDSLLVAFDSAWSPAECTIKCITKDYKCKAEHHYQELGEGFFGFVSYELGCEKEKYECNIDDKLEYKDMLNACGLDKGTAYDLMLSYMELQLEESDADLIKEFEEADTLRQQFKIFKKAIKLIQGGE